MQFIADGPHVPLAVLRAQEEGRLVLFCGAGISIPAGLPTFQGLVDRVYQGLGTRPSEEEQRELDPQNPSYDRALNLLEGPGRFSPSQVRRQVARILATPPSPMLDTHRAILTLARDRTGQLRLVTTNFDRLFQAADCDVRETAAPLLPVPKPHRWDELVHLHGRLDEADPDGLRLVLTSADFGTAYLVERWASRFVSELFRHFTVLFVGYAVDDPPMRYLVDAIAAERRLDNNLRPAFALAGHPEDEEGDEEARWLAKGITPIPYEHTGDHSPMHRTLVEWSRLWAGGLSSKQGLVTELAPKDPSALPPEYLSQFAWAVADESGAMARELGRLGPAARISWLRILDDSGVTTGARPVAVGESIALAGDGRLTERFRPLDPILKGLAAWLAAHLDKPELARWVVARGGWLHPEFAALLRRRLEDPTATSVALRKIWLALTGAARLRQPSLRFAFGVRQRARTEEWGPSFRSELREVLSPCLAVRASPASLRRAFEVEEQSGLEERVRAILSFECELVGGTAVKGILERLAERPDWQAILADFALDLTQLLREALDYYAALDGASAEYDPSLIQQPSIAPHAQNRHTHGWTRLIDLSQQSYQSLRALDSDLAKAVASMWSAIPYPLFRRLRLYACREEGPSDAAKLYAILARDPTSWLWSIGTQVELFSALPVLWEGLNEEARAGFVSLILDGPPREMFREDLGEDEWQELRDHAIWERLARLRRSGASLASGSIARLEGLEAKHPRWRLSGHEREDFPTWMETRWGLPTDFSPEELLALTDDDLARILLGHESHRDGLIESWRMAAHADSRRAIELLTRLREEDVLDSGVWSSGLSGLCDAGDALELKQPLLSTLEALPESLLQVDTVIDPASRVVKSITRDLPGALRERLLLLWDRVFQYALAIATPRSDERVTDAINHPAGVLAEALLNVLRSRRLEPLSGIEVDVRRRLEMIIGDAQQASGDARVIIASRLPLLHDLDPDWTGEWVIPMFAWSEPEEAKGAWQGFLWSPVLVRGLWSKIRSHFIDTFDHVAQLPRERQNLAAILASVCIEEEDPLDEMGARECLHKLEAGGREDVAAWIVERLEGAGPQAETLWREAIGPWLAAVWPREPGLRGPGASERLAWAATLTGAAFPDAVGLICEIVGPIEMADLVFDKLRSEGHIHVAPRSCLELVNALTPEDPVPWFGGLSAVLHELERAEPSLASAPTFVRLRDVAIRAGL